MKQTHWLCMALFMLTLAGCAQQAQIDQPDSFAPPPQRSEQKGDMAPGPP